MPRGVPSHQSATESKRAPCPPPNVQLSEREREGTPEVSEMRERKARSPEEEQRRRSSEARTGWRPQPQQPHTGPAPGAGRRLKRGPPSSRPHRRAALPQRPANSVPAEGRSWEDRRNHTSSRLRKWVLRKKKKTSMGNSKDKLPKFSIYNFF